jgi:pimeloyl-ACP methyl ester carboxylesterase
MPRLSRPDGVEIYWEQRGEGPTIVISPHAWGIPEVFEPLIRELESDHRVVRYDARGTGESARGGPHDMETGAADLIAVLEDAGGPALVTGIADAPNRVIRAAVERPDLIPGVIAIGSAPIGIRQLQGTDALVSSPTVIDAFIDMLATDYRGAMRPLLSDANPQSDEGELRERIDRQVAYTPQEAIVGRIRAWSRDDATEVGAMLGDRLWLLTSPQTAGPWFPSIDSLEDVLRRLLPEAHLVHIEDGIITRPELTADVVRRVSVGLRVA